MPRFVLPLGVMGLLWLVLSLALDSSPEKISAGTFLLLNLMRGLLMLGMFIVGIAAVIAHFKRPAPATDGTPTPPATGFGGIVALLLSALALIVGALGAADAAWGAGGSGEWAGLGDLLILLLVVPSGLTACVLAAFLKTMRRPARIAALGMAIAAIALAVSVPPLRKAKQHRRYEEIMKSGATQKYLCETKPEPAPPDQ